MAVLACEICGSEFITSQPELFKQCEECGGKLSPVRVGAESNLKITPQEAEVLAGQLK